MDLVYNVCSSPFLFVKNKQNEIILPEYLNLYRINCKDILIYEFFFLSIIIIIPDNLI